MKIAIVTGANKGIGFAIAKGLAQKKVHVVLAARNPELGEKAAAQLKKEGLDGKLYTHSSGMDGIGCCRQSLDYSF